MCLPAMNRMMDQSRCLIYYYFFNIIKFYESNVGWYFQFHIYNDNNSTKFVETRE